jgi:hypothetical protein
VSVTVASPRGPGRAPLGSGALPSLLHLKAQRVQGGHVVLRLISAEPLEYRELVATA